MGDYALPSFDDYLNQLESYLEMSQADITRRIDEAREDSSDHQKHRIIFEEICGLYSDATASNAQTIALQEGMLEDDPEGQSKLEEFKLKSQNQYLGPILAAISDFYEWTLSESPMIETPRISVGLELGFRLAGLALDNTRTDEIVQGLNERLKQRGFTTIPELKFSYHPDLAEEQFAVVVSGKRVFLGEIPSHKFLALASEKETLEGLSTWVPFPIYGRFGVWIDPPREAQALEKGARLVKPEMAAFYRLEQQLLRHSDLFS